MANSIANADVCYPL